MCVNGRGYFNTDRKYSIIYADPPWMYRDKMKMKRVHGEIRGAASFMTLWT